MLQVIDSPGCRMGDIGHFLAQVLSCVQGFITSVNFLFVQGCLKRRCRHCYNVKIAEEHTVDVERASLGKLVV